MTGKTVAAVVPSILMALTAGFEHCARIEAERTKLEIAKILSEAGQATAARAWAEDCAR